LKDVVVFNLLLQPPDFLKIMKPAAYGFAFLFEAKEGIGPTESRFPFSLQLDLEKLSDDRASPHLFNQGDLGENFLTSLPKLLNHRYRGSPPSRYL